MKPKVAFSHMYFGTLCNLVFLSSYPLIFFDYSHLSHVWQLRTSYQDHIFPPPTTLQVQIHVRVPQVL